MLPKTYFITILITVVVQVQATVPETDAECLHKDGTSNLLGSCTESNDDTRCSEQYVFGDLSCDDSFRIRPELSRVCITTDNSICGGGSGAFGYINVVDLITGFGSYVFNVETVTLCCETGDLVDCSHSVVNGDVVVTGSCDCGVYQSCAATLQPTKTPTPKPTPSPTPFPSPQPTPPTPPSIGPENDAECVHKSGTSNTLGSCTESNDDTICSLQQKSGDTSCDDAFRVHPEFTRTCVTTENVCQDGGVNFNSVTTVNMPFGTFNFNSNEQVYVCCIGKKFNELNTPCPINGFSPPEINFGGECLCDGVVQSCHFTEAPSPFPTPNPTPNPTPFPTPPPSPFPTPNPTAFPTPNPTPFPVATDDGGSLGNSGGAAVIGASVGGFVAVAAATAAMMLYCRRNRGSRVKNALDNEVKADVVEN